MNALKFIEFGNKEVSWINCSRNRALKSRNFVSKIPDNLKIRKHCT